MFHRAFAVVAAAVCVSSPVIAGAAITVDDFSTVQPGFYPFTVTEVGGPAKSPGVETVGSVLGGKRQVFTTLLSVVDDDEAEVNIKTAGVGFFDFISTGGAETSSRIDYGSAIAGGVPLNGKLALDSSFSLVFRTSDASPSTPLTVTLTLTGANGALTDTIVRTLETHTAFTLSLPVAGEGIAPALLNDVDGISFAFTSGIPARDFRIDTILIEGPDSGDFIPEPAAASMLLTPAALLLARRRRNV